VIWLLACSGEPVDTAPSAAADDTQVVVDSAVPTDTGPDTDASETGEDSWRDHGDSGGGRDTDTGSGPPDPVERRTGASSVTEASATLTGVIPDGEASWHVRGAGDVNDDGFADVLVGAHQDGRGGLSAGAVYLLLGPATTGDFSEPVVLGDHVYGFLGSFVDAADLDGDGQNELLLGAPEAHLHNDVGIAYGAGEVLVFDDAPTGVVVAGDASQRIEGLTTDGRLGIGLGGVGDVDGDGLEDMVLGAPVAGPGGTAYLVLGGEEGAGLESAHRAWTGSVPGQQLGCDADGALDLNGDGYDDLWIGSDADEAGLVGRAYGLYGGPSLAASGAIAPDVELEGVGGNDTAGSTVLGADLDGDGVGDVVVNAYDAHLGAVGGAAFVNHGPLSGYRSLLDSDAIVSGRKDETHGAEATGLAGDLDRDGYVDLVFGTHSYAESFGGPAAGQAFVFYGPFAEDRSMDDADWILSGAESGEQFGWSTTGVGDVDGDGVDDLATSSWKQSAGAESGGAVYVWY